MSKWTEEQLLAINSEGKNIIVSAGAGSGKTAVLSERVLRKINDNVPINRLLILTFTNEAAKEMKDRIRKKLINEKKMEQLSRSELRNGLGFINRHTSVKTTHIKNDTGWNTGDLPYPGITKNTCNLSDEIKGKNIILIDDIYTKTVNVIEDCAQALINCGARDIIVYTVARTAYKGAK